MNWSLKNLAAQSGVSVAAIQKIETGTANTSLLTVFSLSEALGEPMDRLVRASILESCATKVMHVAIPRCPIDEIDLTGRLTDARLKGRVVVLAPAASRTFPARQNTSPMFAYLMEGKVKMVFSDGETETLSEGDAIHLSVHEHMTWLNPFGKRVQILCVTDSRKYSDLTGKGN